MVIDAAVLAKLHASGFLPEVWMPDVQTETHRRLMAERTQLIAQMTRPQKPNPFGSAANLISPYKGCHCEDCRRSSGALMAGWVGVATTDFRINSGQPRSWSSNNKALRYFCATCGTGLYNKNEVVIPGLVIEAVAADGPVPCDFDRAMATGKWRARGSGSPQLTVARVATLARPSSRCQPFARRACECDWKHCGGLPIRR